MNLILFDIDGTLLSSGAAGRQAFAVALAEALGMRAGLEDVAFAGRTDFAIWGSICDTLGIARSPEVDRRFFDTYLGVLARLLDGGHATATLCPGVEAALEALAARADVRLSILTGNVESGATLKLRAVGIDRYFARGAYGSDHHDRNCLGPIAIARAEGVLGRLPSAVTIIGDTPLDVACGKACGARTIAVATGRYREHELAASGADYVLPDLSDLDRLLAALA